MAIEKIRIPDFGDVQKITVVEVFIAPGDQIALEASLIALESEKAVMDIPSPFAGVIKEVLMKAEDVVGSGDIIALIETAEVAVEKVEPVLPVEHATTEVAAEESGPIAEKTVQPDQSSPAHATPSVLAFAREQQVDLAGMVGTGPGGRILREDVLAALAGPEKPQPTGKVPTPPQRPLEDFSKYGPVEEVALGRIQKLSGPHLHSSWISIPHVTHFDEADITDLERFRKQLNTGLREGEVAYSPLVFVIKAVAATLKAFPAFNSSLVPGGEKLVLKKYYHLGIAVDTPGGLMVPVLRDADTKGFGEIAGELKRLSSSARAGKLAIPDVQGATFTISSLGGIGGTGFTPIVNQPQVAILGLSRSLMKPVWDGQQFVPRLILPFSVSYDHRVIDGAEAARFCRALGQNIEDLKRTMI
ncbi:MAG: 2-oxo acid dehydrogenase subunit E2 [Proteobacteria bacterium]|nr:2-oxo acid dehydrogenase subunit E2 [Pseudomonadota bacterium]